MASPNAVVPYAVATVLGARIRQLHGMVLTEALLLAAGGLAGGAVSGWALSEMLVMVLTGVSTAARRLGGAPAST